MGKAARGQDLESHQLWEVQEGSIAQKKILGVFYPSRFMDLRTGRAFKALDVTKHFEFIGLGLSRVGGGYWDS